MRRLWRSPTVRTAVVYGAAGAGFAGANIILARVLPATEYALVTLVLALMNVGFALAPAGLDGIVNRRRLEAGPRLLGKVLLATSTAGLGFGLLAAGAYDLSLPIALLIVVAVTAGGALVVAAAQFQSEQRFGPSLSLLQSQNIIVLVAALATAGTGVRNGWLTILVMTIGCIAGAVWGWAVLLRERHAKPYHSADVAWNEALAFAGVQGAGLLLIQLERLILPHVLPLRELATYGVLAAIAGSLFRVLQMGVGYSLLPRLRATEDVRRRRRLIAKETKVVAGIVLLGSVAILVVTPLAERWLLAGKYHLSLPLVLAALVSGVAKLFNAFTRAIVSALADRRELSRVNLLGWMSVGIATLAAVFGARWGLAGVIYGVTVGWVLRALICLYYTMRHLRLPAVERAPEPATVP